MKSNVLNIFCDPEAYSEYKQNPFVNGDYVVGTDAHIAGYIKKEKIEDVNELDVNTKNYIEAIEKVKGSNKYDLKIKLDELTNIIKSVKFDTDDSHLCPDCKGSGRVLFEYYGVEDGQTYTTEDTCPVCNGDGLNKNYEYLSILGGWFDTKNNVIDIKGCWFNPKYLEKLSQFMLRCNVTTCTFVCGEPTKGCHFNLAEGIDVIIMPVFHSVEIDHIYKLKCEDEEKKVLRIC